MGSRIVIFSIAGLALVSTGCGKPGAVGDGRGPNDLVLRVETAGGFVPHEYMLRRVPEFSLHGDGRLITQGPQAAIYPGPALPNLLVRQISTEGMEAIVKAARGAGLAGPDREYPCNMVADAPTTVFTFSDNGIHRISAYALGIGCEGGGVSAGEETARAKLESFQEKLGDLEGWLPGGSVGREMSYRFEALRAHVAPAGGSGGEEPKPQVKDWPLAGSLAQFGKESAEAPARCGVVAGEDLTTMLRALQSANETTRWRSGGVVYQVWFRPLLPDESGC